MSNAASPLVKTDPLLGRAWPSQRCRILLLLDGREAFHEIEDGAAMCALPVRTRFAASVQDKGEDTNG